MSPSTPRPGGRALRTLAISALVVAGLVLYGGMRLGAFLYAEDSLQPADATYVLAGTDLERPLEGADLYLDGHAPFILLSEQVPEPAFTAFEARGGRYPSRIKLTYQALVSLGVPSSVMDITRERDNTAGEAVTLRLRAEREGWRRVIVVTSKFHLRRAGFAFRRELEGTDIELIMRGSRYDLANPDRWWESRADWGWMLSEVPKLAAYLAGLGA